MDRISQTAYSIDDTMAENRSKVGQISILLYDFHVCNILTSNYFHGGECRL